MSGIPEEVMRWVPKPIGQRNFSTILDVVKTEAPIVFRDSQKYEADYSLVIVLGDLVRSLSCADEAAMERLRCMEAYYTRQPARIKKCNKKQCHDCERAVRFAVLPELQGCLIIHDVWIIITSGWWSLTVFALDSPDTIADRIRDHAHLDNDRLVGLGAKILKNGVEPWVVYPVMMPVSSVSFYDEVDRYYPELIVMLEAKRAIHELLPLPIAEEVADQL